MSIRGWKTMEEVRTNTIGHETGDGDARVTNPDISVLT